MIEDKLTHDERIRLECLALANLHHIHERNTLANARKYERFVRGEDDPETKTEAE